jgi:hypothetical protein
MSYITPKVYHQQAEAIAVEYARLRDSFSGTLNTSCLDITKTIVSAADDDSDTSSVISHSSTRDPVGSIATDLGNTFMNFGVQFSSTASKTLAASYFSSSLRALNAHVIKRVALPTGVTAIRTISQYYEEYETDPAVAPVNDDMSLFTYPSGKAFVDTSTESSYYFSDNFVELCNQMGITYLNAGEDGEIYTQAYYI